MSTTLGRAAVILAPTFALLVAAVFSYRSSKTPHSLALVVGASLMLLLVLAHFCEAFNVFPFMGWGKEGTPGHYLNLSSAILGLALVAVSCIRRVFAKGSTSL